MTELQSQNPTQEPFLEIRDLTVAYNTAKGELRALEGIRCIGKKGEIFGIVGESGCGKSTLAFAFDQNAPNKCSNYFGRH